MHQEPGIQPGFRRHIQCKDHAVTTALPSEIVIGFALISPQKYSAATLAITVAIRNQKCIHAELPYTHKPLAWNQRRSQRQSIRRCVVTRHEREVMTILLIIFHFFPPPLSAAGYYYCISLNLGSAAVLPDKHMHSIRTQRIPCRLSSGISQDREP